MRLSICPKIAVAKRSQYCVHVTGRPSASAVSAIQKAQALLLLCLKIHQSAFPQEHRACACAHVEARIQQADHCLKLELGWSADMTAYRAMQELVDGNTCRVWAAAAEGLLHEAVVKKLLPGASGAEWQEALRYKSLHLACFYAHFMPAHCL